MRVFPLARTESCSFAEFALPAQQTSRAVVHDHLDEVWYVLAGTASVWLRGDAGERIERITVADCVTIPKGTAFQTQAGPDGIRVVAVTAPPWGGDGDARLVPGYWVSTFDEDD